MNSKETILNKLRSVKVDENSTFAGLSNFTEENIYTKDDLPLIDLFKQELETINGSFYKTPSEEDSISTVADLAKQFGWKNCYTPDSRIKELLEQKGVQVFTTIEDPNIIDVSITYCETVAARTGSIAVSTAQNKDRRSHAFAPIHIVLIKEEQLVFDVEESIDFIAKKYNGNYPSSITFITGPSRTADIEKTLILGAHGPKELIAIVSEK